MAEALPAIYFFFTAKRLCAQGVRVGPEGEFSPQTLNPPYAFYNENMGFAGPHGSAGPYVNSEFAAADEALSARIDAHLKTER